MGTLRKVLCQVFSLYVATNMMVCAVLFFPWALPRETVSGLLGRWKTTHAGWRRSFGRIAALLADGIYFWEPNHCVAVYLCEDDARKVLYPVKTGEAKPGAIP